MSDAKSDLFIFELFAWFPYWIFVSGFWCWFVKFQFFVAWINFAEHFFINCFGTKTLSVFIAYIFLSRNGFGRFEIVFLIVFQSIRCLGNYQETSFGNCHRNKIYENYFQNWNWKLLLSMFGGLLLLSFYFLQVLSVQMKSLNSICDLQVNVQHLYWSVFVLNKYIWKLYKYCSNQK